MEGKSALFQALDHINSLRALLQHPDVVDINVKNSEGNTPLMVAVSRGLIEIVQLLLAAGAHIDIRNNEGKRAEVIATENGYYRIIDDSGEDYLYPTAMFELTTAEEQVNEDEHRISTKKIIERSNSGIEYGNNR